jgi:hypothetical protein
VEDFYGYAHVLDYSFRDKVRSGDIDWKIGSIENFVDDGTGSNLAAAVVIISRPTSSFVELVSPRITLYLIAKRGNG